MTALLGRAPATVVGRFPIGSEPWHQARRRGIGGSEISAVLGISRFDSRYSLWHRKAGSIAEQPSKPEMEAGTLLEPVILRKFSRKHPELDLVLDGRTYAHPARPWQISNPDGLVHDQTSGQLVGLVEAKFALYGDEWGDEGTDEVPPYYLCQVRWYLDVLGLDTAWLEVFIGSTAEFRTYRITQDPDDLALMLREGKAFVDSLPGGPAEQMPDLDAHSATYQAVRELHPDIEDVDVDVPHPLAAAFCASRRALAAAEARAQEAKTRLADHLGNGRRARYLGQTLATRQAKGDNAPHLVAGRNLPDLEQETA